MYEFFENLQLQQGHFIRPLVAGTLVAIVCSVIGCFIILRRMSFLADAIAHSMFSGVIAGYLLTKMVLGGDAPLAAMLIGALLAGIATVALVGFVTRFSRIKQDTAIGIMYTGIFALGAFVISLDYFSRLIHIDIYHYVVGNVLTVPDEQLWLLAIVTSVVVGVVILFFRPLQLTSFDPVMAASIGIPVLAVEYLLTVCTSLVVVSGVQIVGVILVVALIISPAATAYLLTDRLSRMIWTAVGVAALGFWGGFALAIYSGGSPGPAVVVVMTVFFLLALAFAPRYGLLADWIRKSSSVPQEIMEDVLGSVLRSPGERVAITNIETNVTSPNMKIRRAINMLARQDLLEIDDDHVTLTNDGRIEANRLVRAHRLWETYLEQTGMSPVELHEKAHQLEHISDRATVDYLDDKLGHPIADPHGSEIPVDQTADSAEVLCSVLRDGDRAEIVQVGSVAKSTNLQAGALIEMGPRLENGKIWQVRLPDGSTCQLNHDQADAVTVKFLKNG
jgi:manganese/iron transport system permease protein/iron/zinc/copper transport system permease protein